MKITIFCKIFILAVFLGLVVFSGSFLLVNNEDTISECSTKQLVETVYNESSITEVTDFHESGIVQKVNLQDNLVNSQDYWDDSETFIIDIKKFKEAAESGNINLRLLDRNFDIEFDEILVLNGGESCHYSGHVKGVPYSRAEFYVYGDVFCGSIEFCNLMYTIAVTSEEYNGKTVHAVFLINWENERKKMEYLLDPLSFLRGSGSTKNLPGTGESNKQLIL
ncbi:hypothetical protein A9239_13210 [Methanosarcina sp. A14]|uniref:Uncharacterized protein n=2 Tax=Methanosarcina barkeri TaxID=2208 RepID=A0A0E3QRG6_METBA|nr:MULTISPECIES: hypothetical protein [Methanosarcina]AKB53082.1 hypothetical protein MSBRM_0084 [Methanosarcina barkeri MS]AKJ39621.1 hypothetical protein MCM1_2611 [Methanosarcina barkeri CM1]OED04228.1 hypothetical protein A9239_13210 [Methanosarcina sp. A14]